MISEGFTLAVIFGLTAAIPAGALGILMMRMLRRNYEQHRDALYREACRAFRNEQLRHWQQIARAKAEKTEGGK